MSASDRRLLRVVASAEPVRRLRTVAFFISAWPYDDQPDPTFVADLERRLRKRMQAHA